MSPKDSYIGDSITAQERSDGSVYLTQSQTKEGPHFTIRMDPLVIAHFLGWLEDTELFKQIPHGFSNLLPDESFQEVKTQDLQYVVDAWSRGFNPQPDLLGPIARDLLRARGVSSMKCSLCGEETLVSNHRCNQNWRTKK